MLKCLQNLMEILDFDAVLYTTFITHFVFKDSFGIIHTLQFFQKMSFILADLKGVVYRMSRTFGGDFNLAVWWI